MSHPLMSYVYSNVMIKDTDMTLEKRKHLIEFLLEFSPRTYEDLAYMSDDSITGEVIMIYEAISEDLECL